MSDDASSKPVEAIRQELLLKELDYRRDKSWKIFAWSSTVLTAFTGGLVALKAGPARSFNMTFPLSVVVTAAVLVIGLHALLWVRFNLSKEADIRRHLGLPHAVEPRFGYAVATTVLMLLAIAAIWVNP